MNGKTLFGKVTLPPKPITKEDWEKTKSEIFDKLALCIKLMKQASEPVAGSALIEKFEGYLSEHTILTKIRESGIRLKRGGRRDQDPDLIRKKIRGLILEKWRISTAMNKAIDPDALFSELLRRLGKGVFAHHNTRRRVIDYIRRSIGVLNAKSEKLGGKKAKVARRTSHIIGDTVGGTNSCEPELGQKRSHRTVLFRGVSIRKRRK